MFEDDLPELAVDDIVPLDVAVGLMGRGYDLNTIEGNAVFDPYFTD